jgi:hypothetical protein
VEQLLAALQDSGFAAYVRQSVFLYPLANVTHVLAVLAFFASVAAMDLRLLGVFGGVPAGKLIGRLRPVAAAAFALIVATGLTLFAPEAEAIGRNPAFRLKLVAILIALGNVWLNARAVRRNGDGAPLVRATAALSLALWLMVAAAGRLIAYL